MLTRTEELQLYLRESFCIQVTEQSTANFSSILEAVRYLPGMVTKTLPSKTFDYVIQRLSIQMYLWVI